MNVTWLRAVPSATVASPPAAFRVGSVRAGSAWGLWMERRG